CRNRRPPRRRRRPPARSKSGLNVEASADGADPSVRPPARERKRLSAAKKSLFAAIAFLAFMGGLEVTLRAVGFEEQAFVVEDRRRARRPAPEFVVAEAGLWEPKPGAAGINAAGFVGPEIPLERTPERLRVACLGDSCTHWGDPPYPARLTSILKGRRGEPVETLNAGVAGYSSWQGLQRLRRKVLPYRPDVVVIYFGWNDHWLWRPVTDRVAATAAAAESSTVRFVRNLRIVRAATVVREAIAGSSNTAAPRVLRVPPPDFVANLREMISLVRGAGGTPVLVTAPTSMTASTPASEFELLRDMSGAGFDTPKALHDAYVDAVRQVAAADGVALCDAALLLEVEGSFLADRIHLSDLGMDRLAELIARTLASSPAFKSR
ncbi:MAG TPA: SGNH/GDSL hydrolase family protein, partial [Planctomycetia bacterium]|nr:SGNH/GDSL hydrolase family protein [Planctomycetia bacterium]